MSHRLEKPVLDLEVTTAKLNSSLHNENECSVQDCIYRSLFPSFRR